jgi:hypothetical protein
MNRANGGVGDLAHTRHLPVILQMAPSMGAVAASSPL